MATDFILDVTVKVVARPQDVINTPHERQMWTTYARLKSVVNKDKTDIDDRAAIAARVAAYLEEASDQLNAVPIALAPTPLADTTATFRGTVHPQNVSTVVTFLSGTTQEAADNEDAAAESPVSGVSLVTVSFAETGLTAETTYYYRVKCVAGGVTTISEPVQFTTTA